VNLPPLSDETYAALRDRFIELDFTSLTTTDYLRFRKGATLIVDARGERPVVSTTNINIATLTGP
jgi:hypothetical protein